MLDLTTLQLDCSPLFDYYYCYYFIIVIIIIINDIYIAQVRKSKHD